MFFFHAKERDSELKENNTSPKENGVFPAEKDGDRLSKKPVYVMHPENAPGTIHNIGFPKDFRFYEYAGATLEVLAGNISNGKPVRRPALVAKMVRRFKTDDGGAFVEMEMTASLQDLRTGKHPHTDSIAAALKMYYEEKVLLKERVVKPQKAVSAAPLASSFPVNNFFEKVNPLTQVK
jgi:hypothetical protein